MFDRDNVMFLADSNHGYKMIGVGKLVAELLSNQRADLLKPFRFTTPKGICTPPPTAHFRELACIRPCRTHCGHEPDAAVRRHLPELVSPCLPTPVTQPNWIYFNDALAGQIGLSRDNGSLQALAGNAVFPDSKSVAQAYSGHQFGQFNPNLGDGRAHLLGEVQIGNQIADLALKGSGRTPYSRGGDGRAALGPMLREALISEHLHVLGIQAPARSLWALANQYTVNLGPNPVRYWRA